LGGAAPVAQQQAHRGLWEEPRDAEIRRSKPARGTASGRRAARDIHVGSPRLGNHDLEGSDRD